MDEQKETNLSRSKKSSIFFIIRSYCSGSALFLASFKNPHRFLFEKKMLVCCQILIFNNFSFWDESNFCSVAIPLNFNIIQKIEAFWMTSSKSETAMLQHVQGMKIMVSVWKIRIVADSYLFLEQRFPTDGSCKIFNGSQKYFQLMKFAYNCPNLRIKEHQKVLF